MFGQQDLVHLHQKRLREISFIILACFGLILARLWYLQVYKGELYFSWSIKNRLRKEVIRAPRGMMFDRTGELLVDNTARYDAVVIPQYLGKKEVTLKKVSKILDVPVKEIIDLLKKNAYQAKYLPIIVKKDISFEELAKIESLNNELPGVEVQTFIARRYRDNEVGAHLLGYISEISDKQLPKLKKRDKFDYRIGDFIGKFGVEEQLDKSLRGINGYELVEVDARGRKRKYVNSERLFINAEKKPVSPGSNIELTIDRDMQLAGFKALEGKVGGVVAVSTETGEVLSMVSRPSFLPEQFSRGLTPEYWSSLVNNEQKPLRARNIQDHFSPGSTFKAITAIAGLEEGVINPNVQYTCPGHFRLGRRVYRCWRAYGHGKVNLAKSIRESCNVYYWRAAAQMDIDTIMKYAKLFGLGTKSGISLPREVAGLIPSKEWKKKRYGQEWIKGETLSCAIGQSYVLTSTLQMALAYGAIANGGKLYKPYVLKRIIPNDGGPVKVFNPELVREIQVKEKTLELVREGLYQVANHPKGTAWWRRGKGNQMAGKTGTSQVIKAASVEKLYAKCEDQPYEQRHHGVFVAFAPYDNPKIAAAALVEHGCHGSSAAAPVVEAVINTYMKKYMPEEYEKNLKKEQAQWKNFWQAEKARREKRSADKEEEE